MAPAGDHPEDRSEDGSVLGPSDAGDALDMSTFEQILQMDDDEEEREFSREIVYDFFEQAKNTFQKMDENVDRKDLEQLSALGHFLKGSSATLGLAKVKDSCEKIQHLGARKDETGSREEPNDDVSLRKLKKIIEQTKVEFAEVEKILRRFYHEE